MTTPRRALPATLWILQWTLAAAFFLLGLLEAGLPLEELQQRLHLVPGALASQLVLAGLLQALVAVALVLPSATGFLPALSPLAAAGLALALGAQGAGLVSQEAPVGLGWPLADLALASACLVVAVGRSAILPVAPLDLGPERRDPRSRTPGPLERARQLGRGRVEQPVEASASRPQPAPVGPSRPVLETHRVAPASHHPAT